MYPIDREQMHRRLDELLDRRARLEAGEVTFVSVKAFPDNCHAAYRDILSFAVDVCGVHVIAKSINPIWKVENEQQAILYALRDRLNLASNLLSAKGMTYGAVKVSNEQAEVIEFQFDIDVIRTELLALAKGDTTALFERRSGRKGQPKNQYQLAKLKLRALEWERFFKSRSLPLSDGSDGSWQIHKEISDAYGVSSWDTIRHWRRSCEAALGKSVVEFLLISAQAGQIDGLDKEHTVASMKLDADEFRHFSRELHLKN